MAYLSNENDILVLGDRHFSSALDHPTWVSWRKNAETCFRYEEGDQWTAAEKSELRKRGQPETVNNQISVTVNRMVGQFVKQKVRIGYRGRNSPQDDPTANTLSDLFLFIRQNNALEFEEREMAHDGFTGGMGVLESYIDFNEMLEPEIKIRAESPFNIFPDPYSRRYDWNEDASYVLRAKWLDLDEAKAMWPAQAKDLEAAVTSPSSDMLISSDNFRKENYIDAKNHRRIRVVEDYYKVREQRKVIFYKINGQSASVEATKENDRQIKQLKKQAQEYKEISRPKTTLMMATFTAGILFEHKELQETRYPFVPYFVTRRQDGEPYSLVWIALPMQDAINKRESKAIHLLNNTRSIYEQGAVTDKGETANEIARADGQVEINRGFFEKFKIDEHMDIGPIHFQMHNAGKADFRSIIGINPDAFGERSEVRSGVGIARKQAMTDVIIAPIFDNLRRTRQILAKNVLELIQNYYTEPKIFSITDDLNKVKSINLDAKTIEAMKQSIYDVVVDDLPDTTTIQEEQMQIMATTLPQILPFGPFWVKMLLQMSELRNKDELIKQLEAMSGPPPSDPKISVSLQWAELTSAEKASFAQKMAMPELAQYEMQNPSQPAHIVKAQLEMKKAELDGEADPMEMQLEQFKAKADMAKTKMGLQADMAKTKMDLAAKREELKIDQAKSQMDMRQAQQKHQLDMRKEAIGMMRDQVKGNGKRDQDST